MANGGLNEKVLELKNEGNNCIKCQNYTEAVQHYTEAIKLDKNSPQLYSNRSLAFLKLKNYYFALQDAKETVRLDPTWAKAYYRQAEVEYAAHHYADALFSYQKAAHLQTDITLIECISRTNKDLIRQRKMDKQTPWVVAGSCFIFGVILVVLDGTLQKKSTFAHPIIQVLVTITFSLGGLGMGAFYRWYTIGQRMSLLEPPPSAFDDSSPSAMERPNDFETLGNENNHYTEDIPEKRTHPRYSKAQARHRYKKGKS